jgi:thiamine-phosphate diphosphorylase
MLVTDRRLAGGEDELVRAVGGAAAGGVNAVQIREKDLDAEQLSELTRRVIDALGERALIFVNGSVEIGANGVHLPENAPIPTNAHGLMIGRSVHSVAAAELAADSEEVDYLMAGPIYETNSHPAAAPAGIGLIRRISEVVSMPVLGIGGIDYRRAPEVMSAGAAGVAVISAILGSPDARQAALRLRRALDDGAS